MENATHALLMAGGILIAILILTLAAYLFVSFGGTAQQIQNQIDRAEIDQFNSEFLAFQSPNGIPNCTIYDVLSVVNIANEFNEKNGFTSANNGYYIKITGPTGSDINNSLTIDKINADLNGTTSIYSTKEEDPVTAKDKFYLKKYKLVKIHCNPNTGRVYEVEFEE